MRGAHASANLSPLPIFHGERARVRGRSWCRSLSGSDETAVRASSLTVIPLQSGIHVAIHLLDTSASRFGADAHGPQY